ncbi:MAG: hypothetical protein JWN07_3429 [Hyphomicrobiales bacterium]|nr:hypothetical protein [Hyphomicrobiales bacterium]
MTAKDVDDGQAEDEDPFGTVRRKTPTAHDIGEPLDAMSVDELDDRIALLRREIVRLEEARELREATRKAADAFFRS